MLTSSLIFFGTCDVLDNPPVLVPLRYRVACPEFLHVPAPRTKTASQFGHVCRMLSMYQQLQTILGKLVAAELACYHTGVCSYILFLFTIRLTATKEQHLRPPLLAQCRQSLQIWVSSLPDHLQFTEDTLEKQIAMFETSSNSGAWCYCYIHTLHPCYVLDLTEVRTFISLYLPSQLELLTEQNFFQAEGRLQAEPIEWIRSQLNAIFRATGNRARNTILCETVCSSQLSACEITHRLVFCFPAACTIWVSLFPKLVSMSMPAGTLKP